MLLALPLLALATWWAVYSGMAPLRRLGRALAERRPQALQPVELPDAPSEMVPMLDALNGLFERIAGLMDAERRFTADAAHELRTPIAAIRAQAQVALGEADRSAAPPRARGDAAGLRPRDPAGRAAADAVAAGGRRGPGIGARGPRAGGEAGRRGRGAARHCQGSRRSR